MEPKNETTASVKVMRSYDYCHFEVALSLSGVENLKQVDDLRKSAARLADKAVEQYKIAKAAAQANESEEYALDRMREEHEEILQKPEGERTPEEKAIVKTIEDRAHRLSCRRYDYEDDWSYSDYDDD